MKTGGKCEKVNTTENLKGLALLEHPELKELVKFAQIMPEDMMREINKNAREKGISMELELASCLLATFVEPEILRIEPLSQKIIKHHFTEQEAIKECQMNHEYWLYPYEIQKLRLFLEFQGKIPRRIKENFILIDVKEETKRILAEMEANENANKKNKKGDE